MIPVFCAVCGCEVLDLLGFGPRCATWYCHECFALTVRVAPYGFRLRTKMPSIYPRGSAAGLGDVLAAQVTTT